jgi:hypothetical protein
MIGPRRIRWVGHVARMLDMRCIQFLGWKTWRVETTRKIYAYRWEDNIRLDLKEIGREDVDWIHLDQDRDQWRDVVNTVMNLRIP